MVIHIWLVWSTPVPSPGYRQKYLTSSRETMCLASVLGASVTTAKFLRACATRSAKKYVANQTAGKIYLLTELQSHTEAASLLAAYTTALYALFDVARVSAREVSSFFSVSI